MVERKKIYQEKQEEVPHPSKGERENHIPDATLSGISPLFESLLSQPNSFFNWKLLIFDHFLRNSTDTDKTQFMVTTIQWIEV